MLLQLYEGRDDRGGGIGFILIFTIYNARIDLSRKKKLNFFL